MKNTTRLFVACFVGLLTVVSVLSQSDPVTEEKWKNGILASATYGGSGATMNLFNGGFMTSIPILSLPGRAGHDLNISLTYNSKQLVRRYVDGIYRAEYFNDGPTAGRWILNVWPSLKIVSPGYAYEFTSLTARCIAWTM